MRGEIEADLEADERWRGERLRPALAAVDCGLVKASDDFIKGFTPPDYQIDGILQRRFIYSLTAPTGAGKTAIALFLSAAVGGAAKSVAGHAVERGRVLYLAGENPDDIRMRWMAMSDKQGFDLKEIDVRFVAGVIPIPDMFDQIAREVESVSLVVVDTSAAYFSEIDENDNVQMGKHARMLRRLTTLPGKPCVLVCCHPTKNATNDNLLPRGGGAFVAEMDGNLVAMKRDSIVELHWHGKLRGPDFAPIGFQLLTVALKDTKGRPVPTVTASPLTEQVRADLEQVTRKDEDALLVLMLKAPGGSQRSMAEALGWFTSKGDPAHYRVKRTMGRLEKYGLVKNDRDGLTLTDKGKKAARDAE